MCCNDMSYDEKLNSTYNQCKCENYEEEENNVTDKEILIQSFGTEDIDEINESFLMGVDFSQPKEEQSLIKARRYTDLRYDVRMEATGR